MGKSWKTTLAGIVFNLLYTGLSLYQTGGVSLRDILLMSGLQAVSFLAKDFNVGQVGPISSRGD